MLAFPAMSSLDTGVIAGAFYVGTIIFSPIAGSLIDTYGKKNSVIFGLILIILVSVGIGLLEFIKS
jgi:MFS family permease